MVKHLPGIFILIAFLLGLKYYLACRPADHINTPDSFCKAGVDYTYAIRQHVKAPEVAPVIYAPIKSPLWRTLMAVPYEGDANVYRPSFGQSQRELAGKRVTLKGYVIPLQGTATDHLFMLSYYPYNLCFLNGNASPASVVAVKAPAPAADPSRPLTVRGVLRLNEEDPEKLFYALEEVEMGND